MFGNLIGPKKGGKITLKEKVKVVKKGKVWKPPGKRFKEPQGLSP